MIQEQTHRRRESLPNKRVSIFVIVPSLSQFATNETTTVTQILLMRRRVYLLTQILTHTQMLTYVHTETVTKETAARQGIYDLSANSTRIQ